MDRQNSENFALEIALLGNDFFNAAQEPQDNDSLHAAAPGKITMDIAAAFGLVSHFDDIAGDRNIITRPRDNGTQIEGGLEFVGGNMNALPFAGVRLLAPKF